MKKTKKKDEKMMMIETSSKSAHDRNQLCQNSGDLLSSDPSSNKKTDQSKNISIQNFWKQMQSCRCHCLWDWQKILSDKWGDINFGMKLFQRNADKQILSLKNKEIFVSANFLSQQSSN